MTGLMEKRKPFLERLLPEHRIYVKSGHDNSTRYLRITPLMQALAIGTGMVVLCWSLVTTTALVLGQVTADSEAVQARAVKASQEARISELAAERDQRAREAAAMRERFGLALAEISDYQRRILEVERSRKEYATGVELMREKLRAAVDKRDIASSEAQALTAELVDMSGDLSEHDGTESELSSTLSSVSSALADTVMERDETARRLKDLEEKLATLEFQIRVDADKQERIFTQLEDAVAVSLEPLEKLLATTGKDVDALIAGVRSQYSGEGGPFVPASLPIRNDEDPIYERYSELISVLDRIHLMQIAASQIPFATPVRTSVRFTSGFGKRRDPINGRTRQHSGQDLAGRPGTPILSAADGEVVYAGRQSGYGNVVKIKHAFGYQTVYAHLKTIDVEYGQTVARGDVIGGMGNTGRSTGTHLHYEIRIGGTAVNPMPYMKAARDVF